MKVLVFLLAVVLFLTSCLAVWFVGYNKGFEHGSAKGIELASRLGVKFDYPEDKKDNASKN